MKRLRPAYWIVLSTLLLLSAGCAPTAADSDVLYQVSTIDALLGGDYNGAATLATITNHGDFGLGTFDALDGEMVVLDGQVYQVRADGKVYRPADAVSTPFAAVVFFRPTMTLDLPPGATLADVEQQLDRMIDQPACPSAVKITGTFRYVKTRSVPRQTKPYRPLIEIVKDQPTFEFHNVKGTLVGLRGGPCMKGLNVPGWHVHFLTADRSGGGHLLECRMEQGTAQLQKLKGFRVDDPRIRPAENAPANDELHRVER